MKRSILFLLVIFTASLLAAACSTPAPTAALPNPASQNCLKQGGSLLMQKRGDGGEYGVCVFPNNLQCEEWAMFNGDCPIGGIDISTYLTPAAQYCAISGGTYSPTSSDSYPSYPNDDGGTCTFKNGKTCLAADFFSGACGPKQ